jgi:hypothetical protein
VGRGEEARSAGQLCCPKGRDRGHVRRGGWTSPFVSTGRDWTVQVGDAGLFAGGRRSCLGLGGRGSRMENKALLRSMRTMPS